MAVHLVQTDPTVGIHHFPVVDQYGHSYQRQARSVTVVVLAVLAIVWIVVLGSYARERFGGRHHDSVSAFKTQLSTLQRTQPGARPAMGAQFGDARVRRGPSVGAELARIRRRNILFGLFGVAVSTALLAVVSGSALLIVANVVVDLALVGYIVLLVNQQKIVAEQRVKVRRLHPTAHPASRAANSRELRPGLAAVARHR